MLTSIKYDATWSVPKSECHEYEPKSHTYCVIIPVINEGKRIQDLIRRLHRLKIHKAADIIIADGGSTDGSISRNFLTKYGVNTLLIKKDTGALSAQLRMAYAFSLQRGYTGIVTIDGNGKDDPETIPDFLNALSEGWDYVQASRYLPNGQGINTPPLRNLAIRFIHAPMVSIAARQWLTDTTQGYRAYSAKYLLHPKVLPFRKIFQRYELLAYLSARASRLHLNVKELPTTRRYPDSGGIPTKISFIRGNIELMTVLANLILGRYNPPK